jgi:hypothetical protein
MRALKQLLTPVAVCLSLLTAATAADWPTDRGDNARTGATDDVLTLPLHATWSIEAPAAPRLAWSSAEGRVIEGKLIGHRIRFDDAFRTVVSEGRMYYGSTVDDQVHCVDLRDRSRIMDVFHWRSGPTGADRFRRLSAVWLR